MKAVMISIKPQECEPIASDGRTVLIKKTKPKIKTPFKCYIYCTVSGATKNCSENEKGRKNLLIDYCRDSILDDRQVITQDLKGRRQLGKHTTHAFNYGTVLNGKVIGEFVCDKIEGLDYLTQIPDLNLQNGRLELTGYTDVEPFYGGKVATIRSTLLSNKELVDYGKGKTLYAWHISDLKIYDKPKEIGAFNHLNKCPNASQNDYDGEWYCDDGYDENAVFNKTKKFPYDEECIYFDCPSCGGENYENEEYAFCMCNGYKPFTRPPQSWQYCEELEDII